MLWRGGRESGNVEDRRGVSGGQIAVGGGVLGVIALILNFLLGGDPSQIPQVPNSSPQTQTTQRSAHEEELASFVKHVLAFTEDVWNKQLPKQANLNYQEPTLVMFTQTVQSGCGVASAQSGPFYCPADRKLYIDLSFYDELQNRFGAPGDFAMAYVIAHEVGHHIQTLLGISRKMAQIRQQVSQGEYNQYSVRMELQADFLAGVWAHYMQGQTINGQPVLERGDIEEALNAANAIGDDRLQKQAQGYVVPESFTHGSSRQRMYWFKKGFDTGDLNQGDTFKSSE
ncbi:MAG: zinc metallopeptidase [Bacteroidota bacterium]|nr:zinc metallopeptidase [Bacteroidota bacterium]